VSGADDYAEKTGVARPGLRWRRNVDDRGGPVGAKLNEAIAEGMSIALAAGRLSLKNQILVDTIAGDAAFETDRFMQVAREILNDLADESEDAANRLKRQGRKAWGKYSQSDGTHDYRDRDVRNLRRRRKQSAGVAVRLRQLAADDEQVRALVEEAREAAWGDVSSNLDRRLRAESMRPDADPDYAKMRDARMQALRLVDLQALESQVRARKKAEKAEKAERKATKGKT